MRAGVEARPVVGWIAGDDPVEVVGVALGLHQALLTALRAADVVGISRRAVVERRGDRLAIVGRDMQRSMPKVGDELRVSDRPRGVEPAGAWPDVAGIGAGGGVPAAERGCHRLVTDDAGHPSVARYMKLAVPAVNWEPDLEVHGRHRLADDPTERRKFQRVAQSRRYERTCEEHRRALDRRVRQRHRSETLACGGGGRCASDDDEDDLEPRLGANAGNFLVV